MKQSHRRRAAPLAIALLLVTATGACIQAPVEVQSFDTERADLAAIRSFALIPPPWPHPVAGAAVEAEIREMLIANGLREVAADSADMLVSYRAEAERRIRRRTRADISTQYTVEEEYMAGTVEIDCFDPESREVIWRGIGSIDIYSEPAIPAAARKAVRAILKDWPPERR